MVDRGLLAHRPSTIPPSARPVSEYLAAPGHEHVDGEGLEEQAVDPDFAKILVVVAERPAGDEADEGAWSQGVGGAGDLAAVGVGQDEVGEDGVGGRPGAE